MRNKTGYKVSLLLIAIAFFLSGCSGADPRKNVEVLTKETGLTSENLQTNTFVLRVLSKTTAPVNILRVYIEGDGFAWVNRTTPSTDPTPRNPVGLKLAIADPSPNVLYLARPCQYIGPPLPGSCKTAWWTSKRFAPEVINAMDEALTDVVKRYPGVQLELIGYSGGATVAARLAARRHDVRSLRTVAGNLDVAYVNALHHVTPMPDALSAFDVANQLSSLPQVHFAGTEDSTVPVEVAKRFQQATGSKCTQVVEVAGMAHGSDWAARWPLLLTTLPQCQ
jgi:pimeloyl-ACP methyl ester carboxylesterase